ncbi:hypothetical protein AMAG_19696 [Allomyces macrogynus ATCC 38327]|uniref:Uncharacterized protein n=1 Tax=Allomyces macrogynus (strain ATCC 38327) TaxID=578462 RepID=A0A0L0SZH4_ALLM3|nr:hypothetical protein AMAG_19696 [Allomyces macrogynus ATCC 38327]|eukprot:KNE67729.1 hypothetical protein AMAG_19696 [Allomyces macrogynus ATCC 38327]
MHPSRHGPPPPPPLSGPPPPPLSGPPPPLHASPWAGSSKRGARDARSDRAADAAKYAASAWQNRGPPATTAAAAHAVRGPGDPRDAPYPTSTWLAPAAEPDLVRRRGPAANMAAGPCSGGRDS